MAKFESYKHIAEYVELNHSWVCEVELSIDEDNNARYLIKVNREDGKIAADGFLVTPEVFNLDHIDELIDARIKESNEAFDVGMAK